MDKYNDTPKAKGSLHKDKQTRFKYTTLGFWKFQMGEQLKAIHSMFWSTFFYFGTYGGQRPKKNKAQTTTSRGMESSFQINEQSTIGVCILELVARVVNWSCVVVPFPFDQIIRRLSPSS